MSSAPALPTVARLARAQHGCWTRAQAVELGVSRRTLDGLQRRGVVVALLPGVLTATTTEVRWDTRVAAALLWAGGDACLARSTAARLHDLRLPRRVEQQDAIHLLVRKRTPKLPPGVLIHRTQNLDDEDVTTTDFLRRTTPARTICDLAGQLAAEELRRIVGHAVRSSATDAEDLAHTAARLGRFRGRAALRPLLSELSPLDAACASELESRFLRLVRRSGIPPSAMNHPVLDVDGRSRRIDAVWLDERVAVELDSVQEHATLLDWNDDVRRETAIVLAGDWRAVLRFSWDDVTRYPDAVVERLRTALRRVD